MCAFLSVVSVCAFARSRDGSCLDSCLGLHRALPLANTQNKQAVKLVLIDGVSPHGVCLPAAVRVAV